MLQISLIKQIRHSYQPKYQLVKKIVTLSLIQKYQSTFIEINIVNQNKSKELNLDYRNKSYPTNVISLEYSNSRDEFNILSGEIILCNEIIIAEARAQNKAIIAHYTHMLVHGILHLQGLDHKTDVEANYMEKLEISILNRLGFANPYKIENL